ncbi:hypothetical protein KIN20_021189 [Parelaphostrongylus tenuis]|uniref:Uncharacterized protein n=1 Tax=Parelaphostrongylus tenuis TaxID=148309 RepID=A0AAD5MNK8_PARTN|nr:hypothetical protein KIN20_021189 [Parelaphostrongylus tenuis]
MSTQNDWEGFEDEELETMLQDLVVSADEDAGNESVCTKTCTLHKVQMMTMKELQPPTVLPFDDPAAGVQHSIVPGCRQPAAFYQLLMTGIWKLIKGQKNIENHRNDSR